MASVECNYVATAGVSLVGVRLTAAVRERVAIEPTHEGPVWPPRRQGVPEAGWDGRRWAGVVDPDRGRALGYATPADVEDPPVRIAATEPAGADDEPPTPRDALRALGDHRPARDAVPPPEGAAVPGDPADDPDPGGGLPDLSAVEARLDRAEALASVDSADEAREAVAAAGGMAAVRDLAEKVEADRAALSRLGERVDRLAARAERVDVPVSALARLE